MLKKTITYTDFNGNVRKQDFYFNLTQQEVAELEITTPGGIEAYVDGIVNAKSQVELLDFFKRLIRMSYGQKSPDGINFYKSDEIWKNFESTQAYSDLYMELATNTEEAIKFFNGIVPKKAEDTSVVAVQ